MEHTLILKTKRCGEVAIGDKWAKPDEPFYIVIQRLLSGNTNFIHLIPFPCEGCEEKDKCEFNRSS